MFRHVATYHLELGQLWRCPVSWCTQWKGTPQDCIDHIRSGRELGEMVSSLDSHPGNVACSSQCHCFRGVDGCTPIQPEWHAPSASLSCVWWGRSTCLRTREFYVSPTDFHSTSRYMARKLDSERSSSLREDSDMQRDLCCRSSQDVSPHCKYRRALSPHTRTISTTTTSSAAVSTPVPRL